MKLSILDVLDAALNLVFVGMLVYGIWIMVKAFAQDWPHLGILHVVGLIIFSPVFLLIFVAVRRLVRRHK